MNILDVVTDVIITILLLPLQAILIPVDMLLSQVPGLGIVPGSISGIAAFIGSLPSTLVNMFGIAPLLWNALFLTAILYIVTAPGINAIKKIWAWVRP